MKGYDFGQVGGNDGHHGVLHKCSGDPGAYPPKMWSKGRTLRPLLRRGPVSPNNVLEKKKKQVCVLGKVYWHLASGSELNLGQSGAHAGASRGLVWPISPIDPKIRGYTPI